MKRIYEFITKANQVLLFLALIAVIAAILLISYSEKARSLDRPHVAVATADAAPAATAIRDVQFLGKRSDCFVFGIVKRTVTGKTPDQKAVMELYHSSQPRDQEGEIVNVVFSRDSQLVKTLLSKDGLVLRHQLPGIYAEDKFSAFLFTCVTEDTNGDRILDAKDRQDLVIVDPELKQPDIIVQGCVDYDLVSPTLVIVKLRSDDSLRFIQIDVTTGTRTEIAWK